MSTIYAKLSTAITVPFGPVLDSTGAEYTGAVVGDIKICKNNGTHSALNASATLTHKAVGYYELVLTTSDISAVGAATLVLSKTTYVAPPVRLTVLPAKVYDSLIAGSDNLEVDLIQWIGVAPLALSSQQVQAIVPATTHVIVDSGTVTTLTNMPAAPTDWLTAAAVKADAVTKMNSGLSTLTAAQVNTEVDAALADIHLDHLLAVDYDPAAKPGVATALLNELVVSDAGVSQLSANALELAPAGNVGNIS